MFVGCLTSSGKHFLNFQDENKLTINTIGRSCIKSCLNESRQTVDCKWLENEGKLDRDCNLVHWIGTAILPCYRPTTDPSKRFCKDSKRANLKHPHYDRAWLHTSTSRKAKRSPHFCKGFTVGRKKTKVTIFPQSALEVHKEDVSDEK